MQKNIPGDDELLVGKKIALLISGTISRFSVMFS